MDDFVVVTGAGLVCSLGKEIDEVWRGLVAGKSGIAPIELFDASGFDCAAAAPVEGLGAVEVGLQARFGKMMEKHLPMLMKCTGDALIQSAVEKDSLARDQIALFAGMGMIDYKAEDLIGAVLKATTRDGGLDFDVFYSGAFQEIYPLWPLAMLNNVAFCQVAVAFDIQGENCVFTPHADSGARALAEGARAVLEGRAGIALAGGVSENLTPLSLARMQLAGVLASPSDRNTAACRPFSAERTGTVLGEGCAMLALELHSSAARRGVPCLARISGFGSACELEANSPTPTSRAIADAMQKAIESAGIEPSEIDVLIAHGDGTLEGDRNEARAIHRLFADSIEKPRIFSSKGALGHLLAGASAVDALLAIQMLKTGVVPPTVGTHPADVDIRFRVSLGQPAAVQARRVLINALSYEGQCESLVIEAPHLIGIESCGF